MAGGARKIVQCHGTFNVFHYGHLVLLQHARTLGDALIVTVTAKRYVNRPGLPVTPDHQRMAILRALACVDDVRLINAPDAFEAVRLVKPDVYVKGREYMGKLAEQHLVESLGGRVVFHHDDEASLIKSTDYLKQKNAREPAGPS